MLLDDEINQNVVLWAQYQISQTNYQETATRISQIKDERMRVAGIIGPDQQSAAAAGGQQQYTAENAATASQE